MTLFDSVLRRLSPRTDRMGVENALALYRRGEARREGLTLTQVSHRLEVAWRARQIHPWARGCEPEEQGRRFAEHSIADTDEALSRLFRELHQIDVIDFKVIHRDSEQLILAGTVERSARVPRPRGMSPRTRLWQNGVTVTVLAVLAFAAVYRVGFAQAPSTTVSPDAQSSSTSTDLFVMFGSDIDRPGSFRERTTTSVSATPLASSRRIQLEMNSLSAIPTRTVERTAFCIP